MKPGKSYYRLDSLFSYTAAISYNYYKYGKAFKVNSLTIQWKAESGLKYKSTSSSVLLNSFLYDFEYLIFTCPDNLVLYDPTKSYKKNSVVLFREVPVIILENIAPGGLIDGKYASLNERQNFLNMTPKQPYWSTASLSAYFSATNNGFFLPSNTQDLANIKYIQTNLSFIIADYLGDPNVAAHASDQYHIHFYDQSFLTDPTDSLYAFKFNFPKRLIFVNSTNSPVLIEKNIFSCFPINSQIKICSGYDDGVDNFLNRNFLRENFSRSIYFFYRNLEITQIHGNKYLIECMSLQFSHSPTYIDMEGKKVIRVNEIQLKGSAFTRFNPSITSFPNTVSPSPEGLFDVINIQDSESTEALNLLKSKQFHQIARLHLDDYTYFFVKMSPSSMGCVKMNNILSTLSVISYNIPVNPAMFSPNEGERNFRILKNYGQLSVPTNQHLFVTSLHNNDRYTYSAYYLNQYFGDNFSFSERINEEAPDIQFVCQTQIKVGDYLYLFDTNVVVNASARDNISFGGYWSADIIYPILYGDITIELYARKFNLNSRMIELVRKTYLNTQAKGALPTVRYFYRPPLSIPFSYKICNYFLSRDQNTLHFTFFSDISSINFTTSMDDFPLAAAFVNFVSYMNVPQDFPIYSGISYLSPVVITNRADYTPPPELLHLVGSSMNKGYNLTLKMNMFELSPGAWYPLRSDAISIRNFTYIMATDSTINNSRYIEIPLSNYVLVGWYDD
jgi:hypothetical protein